MSSLRLYSAAFVCLLVAAVFLLLEGRALSITNPMSLASAVASVAAIALALSSLKRR